MSASVELFSSRICGWAKRNYAALLEKGLSFDLIPANDASGQKKPEFLSLSPLRKTPILKHDEVVVWDSRIINEYIEGRFSGIALLPVDAGLRARARNLNCYCDDILMPLISRLVRAKVPATEVTDLNKAVSSLEKYAFPSGKHGPYWAGNEFSLVDICFLNFFDNLTFIENAIEGLELDLSQSLTEWGVAISERTSVMRAVRIAERFATHEEKTAIQP